MKIPSIAVALIICAFQTHAQGKEEQHIRSIELSDVTFRGGSLQKSANKVHAQNVYMGFSKNNVGYDSTYFLTKFTKISDRTVSLYSVEAKLASIDPSLLDIVLIVYQPGSPDTLQRIIPIDLQQIKKKKIVVKITGENLLLKPEAFFIGFGFHLKNIPTTYQYRLYSSGQGESYILKYGPSGTQLRTNPIFPFTFPFKIVYSEL